MSRARWFVAAGVVTLALAWSAVPVFGQEYVWKSSYSGNWMTDTRWDPSGVPDSVGESATLPLLEGSPYSYAVLLDADVVVDRVTIDPLAATLKLGHRSLTVTEPAGLTNGGLLFADGSGGAISGAVHNQTTGLITIDEGKDLTLSGADGIDNDGVIRVNTAGLPSPTSLSFSGSVTLSGSGSLELRYGGTAAVVTGGPGAVLTNGVGHGLLGDGRFEMPVVNEGLLSPGESAGVLEVAAALTQTASGTTAIDLLPPAGGGQAPPIQQDLLAVSGQASLGGTLAIEAAEGWSPEAGERFTVVTWSSRAGEYETLTGWELPDRALVEEYTPGGLDLVVTYLGDANLDYEVNLLDLGLLADYWGVTDPTRSQGDLNRDGEVNLLDLGILASSWGDGTGGGAGGRLPEPAAAAILLAGAGILLRRRNSY